MKRRTWRTLLALVGATSVSILFLVIGSRLDSRPEVLIPSLRKLEPEAEQVVLERPRKGFHVRTTQWAPFFSFYLGAGHRVPQTEFEVPDLYTVVSSWKKGDLGKDPPELEPMYGGGGPLKTRTCRYTVTANASELAKSLGAECTVAGYVSQTRYFRESKLGVWFRIESSDGSGHQVDVSGHTSRIHGVGPITVFYAEELPLTSLDRAQIWLSGIMGVK